MNRIRTLPPELVNKIAAGEVVERPASVLKELLENSLDAGARHVRVAVEGGGSRLLRVTDDGAGIARADLPLAVSCHATSKIRRAEDLFAIDSLGFRGEALASIAAVSHLRLASRPADEPGAELEVNGGSLGEVRPRGLPRGTTVEVADLFFNVPARRAFLRTERGENQAILNELKRQALARPELHLRVTADGKTAIDAPAADEPRERIAQLLGRELAEDLLAVPHTEGEGMRLRGYVSPCDRSRGNSRQQFFFLNQRVVRDVTLLSAVKTAYQNLLPPRRHPSVLLWLELDPREVDVNVHPQKAEVRFRQDRAVFRLVVRALQATLREQGLVRELRLPRLHGGAPSSYPARSSAGFAPGFPGASAATALLPPAQRSLPVTAPGEPLQLADPNAPATAPAAYPGRFLQVHRRYIVEETPAGIRLVDPHALHERILYEQFLERLREEPLESQRFLFPQLVELGPEARLALGEREAELARLGFELSAFGQNAVAVHAAPRLLKAERVPAALERLLGDAPALPPEEEAQGLLHELAAALACRSAVRFGDALSDDQAAALLAQRAQLRRGHCCPHGRPTALALSLDELDHRFGRQGAG